MENEEIVNDPVVSNQKTITEGKTDSGFTVIIVTFNEPLLYKTFAL